MRRSAQLARLLELDSDERQAFLWTLPEHERRHLAYHWRLWARSPQLPPAGSWRTWLICAGRGFGKTRAGAEWVRSVVRSQPDARIALVAASIGEARAVMVEGESGILAVSQPGRRPVFEPSLRRLTWASGAQAFLYSAGEPESLRGPQHSHAWCDEVAKWDGAGDRAQRAWDNLQLGLRLGEAPQTLATTTPRPVPLLRRLLEKAEAGTIAVTKGSTYENAAYLPAAFLEEMRRSFGRTTLGRQELNGELLQEIEGGLWSRELVERCRAPGIGPPLVRVVIGVDPPASARGDECGIVVCGLAEDGRARVLADASLGGASPERWARAVARQAAEWQADRVVAEANQGGDMVASVLRAADVSLPVKLVHASRGKSTRAEPIAALYEAGRVEHAGLFARLEDQMCGLLAGGSYVGPGRSPDRADALVWALTELCGGRVHHPRVITI